MSIEGRHTCVVAAVKAAAQQLKRWQVRLHGCAKSSCLLGWQGLRLSRLDELLAMQECWCREKVAV